MQGSILRFCVPEGQRHDGRLLWEWLLAAGPLAVEVQFVVSEEEARKPLAGLAAANLRLFYALTPAQFGVVEADPAASVP
jgi:hypothetical protein